MTVLTIISIIILGSLTGLHEYFLVKDLDSTKKFENKRKLVRNIHYFIVLIIIATIYAYYNDLWLLTYASMIVVILIYDLAFTTTYGLLVKNDPTYLGDKGFDGIMKATFHGGLTYMLVRIFATLMLITLLIRTIKYRKR